MLDLKVIRSQIMTSSINKFFKWKFDKELKYAIGFSAVFTSKKFWLILSLKFWNDFTIFDQSVCSNPNKVGHQIYYFMKGHHYILQDQ